MENVVDTEHWPATEELERWLMNTVKEADVGVTFLRQVLQMNPAYGSYLSDDKDLAGIVQLFAKRLKARMVSSHGPVQPSALYEPLCEMAWRVTGHVLHAILNLQDDATLPVPKEPLGQVKMLVQTNMELSKKLNSMRRDYLRELSHHRDKQRTISEEAQKIVSDLQENPVMFFEPLKFVLDEATKDFVRAVVEERVKLEQKTPIVKVAKKDDEVTEVHRSGDDEELQKALNEMRALRGSLAREQGNCKRLEASEKQLREQLEELKKSMEKRSKMGGDGGESEDLAKLREELAKRDASIAELEKAMGGGDDQKAGLLDKKLKQGQEELSEARLQIKDMEQDMQNMSEELLRLRQELEDAQSVIDQQGGDRKGLKGQQKPTEVQKEIVRTVETAGDDAGSLRKQLEHSLQVERELRDANRSLEKALEEEKRNRSLTTNAGDDMVTSKGRDGKKVDKAAMEKMRKEFQEKAREQADEIKRLNELIEELQQGGDPAKVKKIKVVDPGDGGDWKRKYDSMLEEKDEMENKNAQLQQQVSILMDKLREIGGEKAVQEVAQKIKLTPSPVKKEKRQNAFERLYADAQRRIISMRMRAENLEREQKEQLNFWMSRAMNPQSLKILENLKHLQQAAAATQNRFNDAMAKYSDENPVPDLPEEPDVPDVFGPADGHGVFRRKTYHDGAPSPVNPLETINWKDTDAIQKELMRLHRENMALHGEINGLRRHMGGNRDLLQSGIAGVALVPTPTNRGRGDLALGSPPRQRTDSGSPIPMRSHSPQRQAPYMPLQERPLPKPEKIERPAPTPPAQTVLHQQSVGPQDLFQSRPLVSSRSSVTSKGQANRSGENFRRASSDLGQMLGSSRAGSPGAPPSRSGGSEVFSMTAPLPTSSSSSRRQGNSPPRAPSRPHTQLEMEPPWRRKGGSRPSSDVPAVSPEPSSWPADQGPMPLAGRPGWRGAPPEISTDAGTGAPASLPVESPTPPGRAANPLPPTATLSTGRASRSPSGPPPAVQAGGGVPGRPPVVGNLEPIEARTLDLGHARGTSGSPRRLVGSPTGHQAAPIHSRSTPTLMTASLPAAPGSGGLGNMLDQQRGLSFTQAPMPQRTRQVRQGRYSSTDWDAAPVKALPKDMCVTPLRSQEWMTGRA